ncbi:MAG: hypothetical protein GXP43_02530 [bacterium]|nr:hypothetical protein [bacterium]
MARVEITNLVLWEVLKRKGLVGLGEGGRYVIDEQVQSLVEIMSVLNNFIPWRYGVRPEDVRVEVFRKALEELETL